MASEIINAQGLEEEHVTNMLPQIGLDGTAFDERKKENPFEHDEEDYFHDPAWDKAQEKKGEPIQKTLDKWDEALKNKEKVTTEDADDKTINKELKTDIPRNIRKNISKMATLEAKIKSAKELNYEKETIRKLNAELLECKTTLNKDLKSMSKEEKADVKSLIATARASVTKEDKKNEKNVAESVEEKPVEESSNFIFDEEVVIKELTEKRDEYQKKVDHAKEMLEKTGENRFDLQIKGNTYFVEKYTEEIKKYENILITEKADMEKEIAPIVETFNKKGYKVKYASPGHKHLRKKEDQEPDGIFKGKLYSDARVVFEQKYSFPKAPKYWTWKDVDNCSYLDIVEEDYKESDGTPDEAFDKWKKAYMESLKEFANSLKENGSNTDEEIKESVDVTGMIDELFDSLMIESTDSIEEKRKEVSEKRKKVLKRIGVGLAAAAALLILIVKLGDKVEKNAKQKKEIQELEKQAKEMKEQLKKKKAVVEKYFINFDTEIEELDKINASLDKDADDNEKIISVLNSITSKLGGKPLAANADEFWNK